MALGQEELGLRVKQAREEAGLTQPDLAARIGLKHPQSISNYERGVSEIPTEKLRRIAETTKRDMGFFLGEPSAAEVRAVAEAEFVLEIRTMDERLERMERGLDAVLRKLGLPPLGEDAGPADEAANGH